MSKSPRVATNVSKAFATPAALRFTQHLIPSRVSVLGLRVGTLEIRDQLKPKKQYYKHSSALDWVGDLTDIEEAGAYKP